MALPKNKLDREYQKFEETPSGEVSVRTSKSGQDKLDQLEDSSTLDDLKCILTDILETLKLKDETNGERGIISDGTGTKNKAKITPRGQLVTAPLSYSSMYSTQVNVDNTAFNVVEPISGQNFVITDAIVSTNKDVGVLGATITVYEASAPDTLTEDNIIFEGDILKNTLESFIGLNIIVSTGKWINIKSNDTIVSLNIGGYYIDEER